ncbi:MAG TPA: tetratricopeptide repeat protein [Bryobacteraceae bacterium]|nr:tetratricopeptide repeat protein [Bryobacteraceae bacterium]
MSKRSAKRQRRASQTKETQLTRSGRRPILIAAALVILVFAVFGRTVGDKFIYYDDDYYVTRNPIVQRGLTLDGISWALTTADYFYWHPVSWMSHMLDCEIYGLQPAGHHFTNVVIHALTTVMVFAALFGLTGAVWRSALAAALFAIHPLRVESVAWIAERKDLLAGFFWFACILAYTAYARRPSWKRYLWVAALFVLGLMSKPVTVTLPLVLLLLDYWPLGRFSPANRARLVFEKVALLPFSAASGVLTYIGQKRMGATQTLGPISLVTRLENAILSYAAYLGKTFWPRRLALLYPYDKHLALPAVLAAAALLAAITVFVIVMRTRAPFLPVGWFWFLGVLVPMIGIVQVGGQSMADRFTYIPSVGLVVMLVWGAWWLLGGSKRGSQVAIASAVLLIPALAAATWFELGMWKDSVTLLRHTVEVTKDNAAAIHNLAYALAAEGRFQEAVPYYRESLRLDPGNARGYYNLGLALASLQEPDEAVKCFREAARQAPRYAEARYSLGAVLLQLGRTAEARGELQAALHLSLSTEYASQAHFRLGMIAAMSGDFVKARDELNEALLLKPEFPEARENLARVNARLVAH